MKTKGVLHDESKASRLLMMTCDTLLFLSNEGVCKEMIVKTENNPYVNDQHTLLGKNIFDYFPDETVRELKPAIEHVARTGEVSNANYNLPSPEKLYYFKCIIQKYDEGHVLCQYRDITRRSQMKKSLQIANERLRETERAAKIGYWSYNTSTKMLHYSGYVGVLFEENLDIVIPLDEYLKQVYPEDRRKVERMLDYPDHLYNILEFRLVKDKTYYLRLKIVNIHEGTNGEIIVDGYAQNIDDIVARWNELKMVTLAVNNSEDSVFATKMDGTLIFANRLCRLQNEIGEEVDITEYKSYDLLKNFTSKQAWSHFIKSLESSDNTLAYTCHHPYPRFNVISSACSAYVIRNEYGEDVIWHHRRDTSEQVRYENRLKSAKERAEESDRLKSAFLSNMSHEIRTPLNAIVGFSAIMADIDDRETRGKFYNIVESSNKRLLALIDEVLDLSKIESGRLEFNFTSLKINDLCHEIVLTHQLYVKQASMALELPEEDTLIKADKNRLTQVISNLINNAIKFTPTGTIALGYKIISGKVEFYVRDTGIGIPEGKLNKIFDRFEKVDHFAPGTGLGLSICKTIVERMGGDIAVSSKEGAGSLFSFRIPLQPAELETGMKPRAIPVRRSRTKGKATILVAEDMDDNFELINAMIGSEYHLLRATDGKQAIELYELNRPDLILMDIKMPGVSGVEAIQAIRRQSPVYPPIIAVSAYAYSKDKKKLLDHGCNDFLAKPLDKEVLIATLHKYV